MKWDDFDEGSRIWIYNSTKPFSSNEMGLVQKELDQFCKDWTSHNNQLYALGRIMHQQFIVIMLDESKAGASGCSIDKSVAFIRNLQQKYGKDLFNRMNFSYLSDDGVISVDKEAFKEAYHKNEINDDTLVFDHLVNSKAALNEAWKKPLKDSWHKRFV